MKHRLLNFLFGEAFSKDSPNTTKGLTERGSIKPSLHSKPEAQLFSPTGITYRLVRAKRKTVGFVIDAKGLTVRAPQWITKAEIDTLIHQRETWILEKLEKLSRWQLEQNEQRALFVDGTQIAYLGGYLTIRVNSKTQSTELIGQDLLIKSFSNGDGDRVKAEARIWFKNEAKRYLGARLMEMATSAGLSFKSWSLSSARTRWGCCTSARTLRLHWMLIHLEPDLIDYVIAHELAHLDEMNHGVNFWKRVQSLCPDYEARRRRLKSISIAHLPFADD